jgi:hypothetical protein
MLDQDPFWVPTTGSFYHLPLSLSYELLFFFPQPAGAHDRSSSFVCLPWLFAEEEIEDLGVLAERANVAKAYVDGVRKRKGMFVEKKIVEFAEKQRTLKR